MWLITYVYLLSRMH